MPLVITRIVQKLELRLSERRHRSVGRDRRRDDAPHWGPHDHVRMVVDKPFMFRAA